MKRKIKRLIFVLAYWCGIDALFYFLNRKAKRIVVFHNVIRDDLAEGIPSDLVGMRLSEFKRVIQELAKRFGFSNDINDPKTVTITFDDGYRNQYTTAFRYLHEQGIPGILFFSPGTRDVLTIDKMVCWRSMVPHEYVRGGDIGTFWAQQFWPRFLRDGASRGKNTLKWLDEIFPVDELMNRIPSEFQKERFGSISNDELSEMRKAGWQIGWHTKTHTPLSALSNEDLRDELDAPAEFNKTVMAFPYGTDSTVGDRAIQCAKEMGFPAALSYANHSKNNRNQYFLPRMPTLGKCGDVYEFQAEMSGFRYFLSYGRLLPKIKL